MKERLILLLLPMLREGIDLKGVRKMVLMMPPWSEALLVRQIVGRSVRYKSHIHLPEEERHVDIYFILAVPPEEIYKKQEEINEETMFKSCAKFNAAQLNYMMTGDQCLYGIIQKKRREQKRIMKMLKEFKYNFN